MKMPIVVWKKIVSIRNNFLWGGANGSKKLGEMDGYVCCSKDSVGMGIRNLRLVNVSLLMKFWQDTLVGIRPLYEVFLRLHFILIQQDQYINQMGEWASDTWCWDLKFK
jgi:hypothetical protein